MCIRDRFQSVYRDPAAPNPHVESKADDFREYFRSFGIARTALSSPRDKSKTRILATTQSGEEIYAAEFAGQWFFLPLKDLGNDREVLRSILTVAARSILAYKRRNDVYLPQWVDNIRFKEENEIATRLDQLKSEAATLQENGSLLKSFKAVLVASGRSLNEIVVSIFKSYFGLNLKSEEAYVEDAIIYDGSGSPKFVVEIKGVNGGLKREHINQVDSHRERLKLAPEVPGLLVINDFADSEGFDERKAKPMNADHLLHASRQNVKVLRTTTLIEFMLAVEGASDRRDVFLEQCELGNPLVEPPSITGPD